MATEDNDAYFDRLAIAAEVLHQVREELRTLIREEVQRALREELTTGSLAVSRSNRYDTNDNDSINDEENNGDIGRREGEIGPFALIPRAGLVSSDPSHGSRTGCLDFLRRQGSLGEPSNSTGLASMLGWGELPEIPRLGRGHYELDHGLRRRRYEDW